MGAATSNRTLLFAVGLAALVALDLAGCGGASTAGSVSTRGVSSSEEHIVEICGQAHSELVGVVNRYFEKEEKRTGGGSANIRPGLAQMVSDGLGVTERTIADVHGSGAFAAAVRSRLMEQRTGLEAVARELDQHATIEAKLEAGWWYRVGEFLHGCDVRRGE